MKVRDYYEAAIEENGKIATIKRLYGRSELGRGDLRRVDKKYLNKEVKETIIIGSNNEIVILI